VVDEDLDFDDPETVMREARSRFIEAFPGRVRSITMLFNAMSSPEAGGDASQATARRMTHQMTGIAGTLGFPGVSEKAADLEQLVIASVSGQPGVRPEDITRALAELTDSFARDMAKPAPAWAKAPERPAGPRVLIVEDDDAQRKIVSAWLRSAGYQVSGTGDGGEAFTKARLERPALIILDVDLPGTDSHALCRKLKTSPDLSGTPVVLITTPETLNDRVNGSALGADDFVIKPVDQTELVLRVGSLLKMSAAASPEAEKALLTYEAFAFGAQEMLRRESVSLALIRVPRNSESSIAIAIAGAAGPTDLVAMFDSRHVAWLMPGAAETTPKSRVDGVIRDLPGACAGIAFALPGTCSLGTLLGEADEQLPHDASNGSRPEMRTR
jgi:CheY-like chemotaxis protein